MMLKLALITLLNPVTVGEYTIVKSPKAGDSIKYAMKAELKIDGTPIGLSATIVSKVAKVESDGTYVIEESQIGGLIKFKEQEIKAPQTTPSISRHKSSGEVIDFINEQGKHDLRIANLTVFKLPGKPVKTGDTWTWEQKGDKAKDTVSVRALYTVGAEETVGTHKCVKIKQVTTETEGVDPASVESTIWYDLSNWTEVKISYKWNNVPMSGGSPVTGTITLDRVDEKAQSGSLRR